MRVGRRGRTETYIECQPWLLSDEQLHYLWHIFSAEALTPNGSLYQLLEGSSRFAGDLAKQLQERIYDRVVQTLAQGISQARGIEKPDSEDISLTYEMALIVLFRLLFIAYAEDRDLLPYGHNDAYKRRSLKVKAQELSDAVIKNKHIAGGSTTGGKRFISLKRLHEEILNGVSLHMEEIYFWMRKRFQRQVLSFQRSHSPMNALKQLYAIY